MPAPTDASERPPRDSQDTWLVLTASQLGASHQVMGLPNQDAVAARQLRPDVLAVAVADGHGHHRHFRSGRGSELAVAVAGQAAAGLASRLDELGAAGQIESEALGTLVPAIAGRWRDAVRDDLAARPFTAGDEKNRYPGDDPMIAYGSTLLLAIAAPRWLVLLQIGDGDIVAVQPDGRALLPVPGDPTLDGHRTTSLCGPRAEDDFRVAVVDTAVTPLAGVLLATDGYGNAQAADPWPEAVSADLAKLIGERSPEWLAAQLPSWAGRCASADGSADDTTIALLIAPPAVNWRQAAAEGPASPGASAGPDVPAPPPAGQAAAAGAGAGAGAGGPARPPAARSRRLTVIGAAAAVVVAVAVFLAVSLGSSSGPAPARTTSCSSPSAGTGIVTGSTGRQAGSSTAAGGTVASTVAGVPARPATGGTAPSVTGNAAVSAPGRAADSAAAAGGTAPAATGNQAAAASASCQKGQGR